MKKYVFKDESWWDDPGCDCCEPSLMECWNCIKGEIYYSCHSLEDCYVAALYKEGVFDVKENGCLVDEDIYGWSLDQLKQLCEDNGIEVVFVNEEDLKYA